MTQDAGAGGIRYELDQLADRRRRSAEEQHALVKETADLVRRARAAGLRPTEIARRLGISRKAVYEYLEGDQDD